MGHRKDHCPTVIKKPESPMENSGSQTDSPTRREEQVDGGNNEHGVYRKWMMVKRKKKPTVKA